MKSALTPIESDRMRQAADMLLEGRRTLTPIDNLPLELRPHSLDEVYFVHEVMAEALGPIGGWKVGRATAGASPIAAPMPLLGGFVQSGGMIARSMSRMRGVEAELAFHLGNDLPPRAQAYTRDEVIAAIASCHPAVEVLESAFLDPEAVDANSRMADLLLNGGFAYGQPFAAWQSADLSAETASMSVDGVVRVDSPCPAGLDPLGLLIWLANEGQSRTGGLRAGDWVTTGTWTGKVLAGPDSEAIARFSTFGEVRVSFE